MAKVNLTMRAILDAKHAMAGLKALKAMADMVERQIDRIIRKAAKLKKVRRGRP